MLVYEIHGSLALTLQPGYLLHMCLGARIHQLVMVTLDHTCNCRRQSFTLRSNLMQGNVEGEGVYLYGHKVILR